MFDEQYIYFMKDISVSHENSNYRKIGNRYNIKLLSNAIIDVKILYIIFRGKIPEEYTLL